MKRNRLIALLFVLVMAFQGLSTTAGALEVKDVAGEFICNCGCGKGLANCDMQCGVEKRAFIKEKIAAGGTRGSIIEVMKTTFGTEILAAPEKKGFHLVAWIFPFALVFFGIVSVVMTMRSWIGARRLADAETGGSDGDDTGGAGSDHTYDSRIDKDLKEFDW